MFSAMPVLDEMIGDKPFVAATSLLQPIWTRLFCRVCGLVKASVPDDAANLKLACANVRTGQRKAIGATARGCCDWSAHSRRAPV